MKSKLILLMAIAGASAFGETHFSIHIGGYGPGYYAPPPPVYYAPVRPWVYRSYGPGWGGAGYWGEDPARQHERAEWYGLHNHQEGERYMYGTARNSGNTKLRSVGNSATSSGTNGTETTTPRMVPGMGR